MRTRLFITTFAALLASMLIALPAVAAPVTERQKRDCKADYQRYCKAYKPGTEALRACMSRSVRKLSNRCVAALVDSGEMTQAQADRLRKATAKKTTKKTASKKTAKKRTTSRKTAKRRTSRRTTAKRGSWNPFNPR